MDSFEAVVAAILQRQGYWTQTSVKVDLTKEEKRSLQEHFKKKGWVLYGPKYIREELMKLQNSGYENDVATVVAKLLLRNAAV